MTNHSKEVGTFSRVSGLHGAWICDWTSHVFADLGTVAKKHQMYWAVLFMLQLIKTHPSQSPRSGQTILWPTQVHWASINRISSAALRLQLCRAHCLGQHTFLAPGATLHGDWTPRTTDTTGNGHTPFCLFFITTTQVLCTETVQVRAGQSRTRDLTLLVATMSTTQPTRPEWVWVSMTTDLLLWDPGRNTFRRDWLIMWFKPGGVIAIGFQHGYLLQMIGSDCSGWNFSSWFYKKNYSLNRRGDFSFGVGRCLPGRQGKDVILCSPAAFLFHDPEDHVHRRILHLPCDTDASLSGPGFL